MASPEGAGHRKNKHASKTKRLHMVTFPAVPDMDEDLQKLASEVARLWEQNYHAYWSAMLNSKREMEAKKLEAERKALREHKRRREIQKENAAKDL